MSGHPTLTLKVIQFGAKKEMIMNGTTRKIERRICAVKNTWVTIFLIKINSSLLTKSILGSNPKLKEDSLLLVCAPT